MGASVEFYIYSVFCLSYNYPVFVSDAHLLYRPNFLGRSGPLYYRYDVCFDLVGEFEIGTSTALFDLP